MTLAAVILAAAAAAAGTGETASTAESDAAPCPAARDVPQLTIDEIREPLVPVMDGWQVFWGDVPLSDAQVALLSKEDPMIELTRQEMESRGSWVYIGMATAAFGAAVSSAGWVLYGQNQLDQGVTLSLAAGGLLLGMLGVLVVTESIQTPLEPHLAPTPEHRISREEMRRLVTQINRQLYRDICDAADRAREQAAVQ